MKRYESIANPGISPVEDIPYLAPEDFKTTILSQIGAGRRIGMLGLMPSLDDLENHNLPPHHPLLLAVLIADDLQAFLIFATDPQVSTSLNRETIAIKAFMPDLMQPSSQQNALLTPCSYTLHEHNVQEEWCYTLEGPVVIEAHCEHQLAGLFLGEAMLQAKSPLAFLQCATSLPVAQGYAFAIIDEVFGDCHIEENVQKARFILLEIERAKQYVRTLRKTAAALGLDFLARAYAKIYHKLAFCCERLTGTTTGKWSIFPGGVRFFPFNLEAAIDEILLHLHRCNRRFLNHPMVVSRLDSIGVIEAEIADELGLSGFSARACGRPFDIRKGLPYGFYRHIDLDLSLTSGGSVYSRMIMAAHEAESALGLIRQQHPQIQDRQHSVVPLKSKQLALTAIEASSGQLIHAAVTNNTHQIVWYKINDATTTHVPAIEKSLMGAFFDDRHLIVQSFARHHAILAP
jgi:Ni,Fe-hydrogenase III large subunit